MVNLLPYPAVSELLGFHVVMTFIMIEWWTDARIDVTVAEFHAEKS